MPGKLASRTNLSNALEDGQAAGSLRYPFPEVSTRESDGRVAEKGRCSAA